MSDWAETPRQQQRQPDEGSLIDLLQVALTPGVGPLTYRQLIERFGSPSEILAASTQQLEATSRVGRRLAAALLKSETRVQAEEVLNTCRRFDVRVITERDADYPTLLREIPDPPAVLFVRGQILPVDRRSVAIVGSRSATGYGRRTAERLARELSEAGVTVVSGLARGIDASGHRAALQAGGRTLAVLGGGVLNIYPPEHVKLAELVAASGAVLSESPPFQPPRSGSFPRRNRLISGLCLGTIVVEASRRSGALISARLANEQGREVFAIPGRIDSPTAAGCHQLIKDGAKLVESLDDILCELDCLAEAALAPRGPAETDSSRSASARPERSASRRIDPSQLSLSDSERLVLENTTDEAIYIDDVISGTGLPPAQVLAAISGLEMHKLLRRVSGAMIARV